MPKGPVKRPTRRRGAPRGRDAAGRTDMLKEWRMAQRPTPRSLLIINPAAGPGWRRGASERLLREVSRCSPGVEVARTTSERRAEAIAAEAVRSGFERIIVAGGDGTVQQAVNGMAGGGEAGGGRASLAILPLGTSNVLAREIGLPLDPFRACRVLAEGDPQTVHPGRLNDRLFLLMAGIGVDAEVVRRVETRWLRVKPWCGIATYLAVGLSTLATYRYPPVSVTVGKARFTATTAIIAKARHYGGAITFAPDASLQRPAFSVCLFHHAGPAAYLGYTGRVLLGRHRAAPAVTWFNCRELTLAAAEPVPVQADGERAGHLPAHISVSPRTLELWYPRPTERREGRFIDSRIEQGV